MINLRPIRLQRHHRDAHPRPGQLLHKSLGYTGPDNLSIRQITDWLASEADTSQVDYASVFACQALFRGSAGSCSANPFTGANIYDSGIHWSLLLCTGGARRPKGRSYPASVSETVEAGVAT